MDLCDEINKMKEFLLFIKIFEIAQGKDELERFEDGLKLHNLKGLFDQYATNIEIIFNEKNFINFGKYKRRIGQER